MKYRKKPVVIDAVQWNGDTEAGKAEALLLSAFGAPPGGVFQLAREATDLDDGSRLVDTELSLFIETLEGTMRCDPGDWIIRGVSGEFYPCKPDIFEKTYEPAE